MTRQNKGEETMTVWLIEKSGYNGAIESYATLKAKAGTDISELVKGMRIWNLMEAKWDSASGRYVCTSAPLTKGRLESRLYRVYKPKNGRDLYEICREFERKQNANARRKH